MIRIDVNIKNKSFNAVYDPGSTISLINEDIVKRLKTTFFKDRKLLSTINGHSFSAGRAFLKVRIGNIVSYIDFHVVKNKNFNYQLLLGLDAIQRFKLLQNENLDIFQRDMQANTYLKIGKPTEVFALGPGSRVNVVDRGEFVENFVNLCTAVDESDHNLTAEQKKKLMKLIDENIDCFATDKFDVGRVKSGEAQIRMLSDKIISQRPYRCSLEDKREIEAQVKQLLDKGLISESCSPFASPVTLAYKKEDGRKSRLCVDFRQFNKLVTPEAQPFPLIEDMMERLADAVYLTVIDINSAFWAIPIVLQDREKLAFVTQDGHYQFNVLPFGFRNSPAIFTRILTSILRKHGLKDFAMNYMDDILVYSKTFDEHLEHLNRVLRAINEEGFKLKLTKCRFARSSVNYLGHTISRNQIRPIFDGLKAIRECPRPQTASEVRRFLGKVNYYNRFIENCTNKMEPLHQLLRTGVVFEWTEEREKAFQELKDYMCSQPVLQLYDPNKLIYIYSDASGVGVGAVMKQEDEQGILHPVSYFSKKLPETMRNRRDAIYLEALAIKEAICCWQHRLMGREFVVVTDHKPLLTLKVKARPDTDLGHLVMFLSQFNFRIVYQEGSKNIAADWLSRYPASEWIDTDEPLRVTNLLELSEIEQDQENNPDLDKELLRRAKIVFKIRRGRKRVIISPTLGEELLRRLHRENHIGANAMLNTIRPFYYFKKMDEAARRLTDDCEICIRYKTRTRRRNGQLDKLGPPKKPFEVMSLDSVGGFGGNNSTKRYLHCLTDHFTKFAWTATTRGQQAKDIENLVRQVADKHQIGLLLADQYASIRARDLKKFAKERKFDLIFTAADCASSNGNVERLGQTLVNRIRCKFNDGNQNKSWATVAEQCTANYNETVHSVTGFTPKYLLTGEERTICPIATRASDLEVDRKLAFERLMKDHERNKKRVDKNRTDEPLEVGDLVYADAGNKINRNKLAALRQGPFAVRKRLSPLMFELDRRSRKMNVYHKAKLLKVRRRLANLPSPVAPT